jgi:hypothetical protein
MSEIEAAIGRLREAYVAANRKTPGPFVFVSRIGTVSGGCTCVVVLASDDSDARLAAARSIAA